MNKPLRVLIIEDSEDDAILLLRELRRGGYEPVFERVETAESMNSALKQKLWDLVISDYVMPQFSGSAALKVLKESSLDIPFIIVSGNIGEDIAVEAMKSGASDYITKGNLARLVPAIERELREADGRLERRRAEEALRRHYEELEQRVEERTSELREINGLLEKEIAERGKMEELIRHQAYHDSLTGLPNRVLFMDHLNLALAEARRKRVKLAVMFLDLDRFKHVNDSFGHATGDRLLKDVSARLKRCIRESDTVARIGGDEFMILIPEVDHEEYVASVAEKVLATLRASYKLNGHDMHMTVSIGISTYPGDSEFPESLITYADTAMYHAKQRGKNNYRFYNSEMHVRSLERMIMENSLRSSLVNGELVVYYQPQIEITTGRIISAEALVRWQHPERGILHPAQFLPVAEEIGLIGAIDEWVLRTACARNRAWQETGFPPIIITVNLSSNRFHQPDLAETVSRVIKETGVAPRFLELEITEQTVMEDMEFALPKLAILTGMGVRFAIDDFGTGYSSLSSLKKLPLRRLKIDRSLISGLQDDPDYKAIVNAVVAMAHSLRLKVIAEGVETEGQLEFLRATGCDDMQGYLFHGPLPADRFEELLIASQGRLKEEREQFGVMPELEI